MLVALVIGVLRETKERSPAGILRALNHALLPNAGNGFVTCCCVRFLDNGSVLAANAGNPQPYCDGVEVELESGLPLGITADAEYVESTVLGESLTFVSDGVLEAQNSKGELFGFERTGASAEVRQRRSPMPPWHGDRMMTLPW